MYKCVYVWMYVCYEIIDINLTDKLATVFVFSPDLPHLLPLPAGRRIHADVQVVLPVSRTDDIQPGAWVWRSECNVNRCERVWTTVCVREWIFACVCVVSSIILCSFMFREFDSAEKRELRWYIKKQREKKTVFIYLFLEYSVCEFKRISPHS